jgi:Spy/CpxP family protein refolding chaperone
MQLRPVRFLWLLAAAFLVASLALPAHAQRGRPQGQRGFPAGLAEARLVKEKATELGVSEETLKKIEELTKETRDKEREIQQQLREATTNVQKILDQNRPDEKTLLEAAGKAAGIARQTRDARLHLTLEVRKLLTDEQLAKFMEMRTKAMGARRAKGGGRPKVR